MDDNQYLRNLVEFMPRRLKDMVEQDGGTAFNKFRIKYTRNMILADFYIFVSVKGRFLHDRPNLLSPTVDRGGGI